MGNISILIVDDTRIIGTALKVVFAEEGFSADYALSGEDAVDMVREKRFDIVLIDLVMPGMDGVQTCTQIKMIRPDVECLLMTGHIDERLQQREMEFIKAGGKVRNLYKPFSGDEVLSIVRKIISKE